jgi:Ca-activated chloride channel family protein
LYPHAAWLFLAYPFFIGTYLGYCRWQSRHREIFAETGLWPGLQQRPPDSRGYGWRMGLWFFSMTMLVLGLARPQWISNSHSSSATTPWTVYMVMDTSLSMQTQDAAPSRLTLAKRFCLGLMRLLPQAPLGLIVFESEAKVVCPPTLDHWAFAQAVEGIQAKMLGQHGSQADCGLELALKKIIRTRTSMPAAIVLLSDGEMNRPGNPEQIAREAAAQIIPIFTVGVGTEAGGPIPLGADFWGKPIFRIHQGQRVHSRLQPQGLRHLAQIGTGEYVQIQDANATLWQGLVVALQRHPWLKNKIQSKMPAGGGVTGAEAIELFPWAILLMGMGLLAEMLVWAAGERRGA